MSRFNTQEEYEQWKEQRLSESRARQAEPAVPEPPARLSGPRGRMTRLKAILGAVILVVIGLILIGESVNWAQARRFTREALAIDEPFILTDRTQLDPSLEQARKVIVLGARRLIRRSLPAEEASNVVITLMSIEERFVEAMEEAAEGSVIYGHPVAGVADELRRAVWPTTEPAARRPKVSSSSESPEEGSCPATAGSRPA